ncbi:hypothetical protein Tco_1173278 [Tanacetum coccineum]
MVAKNPPSVEKITHTVTSEGTGDKPRVPDVTEDHSTESDSESWGFLVDMRILLLVLGVVNPQLMHTTMVPEQVKTMKIQAGIQVSRPRELRRHLQLWKRFGRLYLIVSLWALIQPPPKLRQGTDNAYLLFYVDDIILAAYSKSLIVFYSDEIAIMVIDRVHMDNCQLPVGSSILICESKLGIVGDLVYETSLTESCSTLDYGLQLFSSSTTDLVAYSIVIGVGCQLT